MKTRARTSARTKTREAIRSDLAPLAAIAAADPLFQQYGMTEESALKLLKRSMRAPKTELWVAIDAWNAPLGFALFVHGAGLMRSAYLRLIAVSPEAKRGGVGRALIHRMEDQALRPHGILLLVTSKNHRARRFYEAMGYSKVGLLRDYVKPGLHECLYLKRPEA